MEEFARGCTILFDRSFREVFSMSLVYRVVKWMMLFCFGKRAARRKIRQVIRGYRRLRGSADRGRVSQLKQELTLLRLNIDVSRLPGFMFGRDVERAEIAARQLLFQRLTGRRLNSAILRSIASPHDRIAMPLPGVWIKKLSRSGFGVSEARSRALFAAFVVLSFGLGVARFLYLLTLAGMRGPRTADPYRKYVQFCDLTPNNLPQRESGERFDIVSWYLGWSGRVDGLREVRHTVPFQVDRIIDGVSLSYSRSNLPELAGFKSRLRYALWGICSIFYTIWETVCGRWACAVLFEEAAIARKVELLDPKCLAAEYLFSMSEIIKRPLWTYAAERSGSKVALYCYGAGMHFRFKGIAPRPELGLQSMTWPRVLVFSTHHQAFMVASVDPSVRVELVPPIHFSDCGAALPKASRPCVAVFDATPTRMSVRASLIPVDDFRTLEVGIRFLEEIYEVLVSHGYSIMWKKKRSTSYSHSKGYIKFADSFGRRPGVVEVHPDIAAARVIRSCFAAISMPFTSTGLLARYSNIASVFYDPMGTLSPDDPAALGVPLITGVRDLNRWVGELTYPEESARAGSGNLNGMISGSSATFEGPAGHRNGAIDGNKNETDTFSGIQGEGGLGGVARG